MTRRAFVTGVNGHLGSHLVRVLLNDGWAVSALVRKTSNLAGIQGLPMDLFYGDVSDLESMRRAAQGCQACFHLASPTTVRSDEEARVALAGIENVCALLKENRGIERAIHVSSTITVGVTPEKGNPLDETSFMRLTGTRNQIVKWQGEEFVLDFLKQNQDLHVVIVNPSTIMGPGDYRPTPPDQLVIDFLNYAGTFAWLRELNLKAAPVWFTSGFSLVDVEDVARGIYHAFLRGRDGERYILGGDNIEFREFYRALSEITGLPSPFLYIPKPVMLGASWVLTRLMRHPPMSYALAKTLVGKFAFFSSDKAKRELEYSRRPYRETLRRTVKWFLETSLIREERKEKIRKGLAAYRQNRTARNTVEEV
ncbi:MAG: NAD-dependent epimerase/dehydratase family protein [Parcubacteria group bacterium]|nr:NAD-dependent epimerase/dehydratase family protein [Parcubacteria group bacterium]